MLIGMDVDYLKRMNLGTMLGMGFSAVILICVCVAGFGWIKLNSQAEQLRILAEDRVLNLTRLQQVKDNVDSSSRIVRNIALLIDKNKMIEEKRKLDAVISENSIVLDELERRLNTDRTRQLFSEIKKSREPFVAILRKAGELGLNNENEAARELIMGNMLSEQEAYFRAVDELVEYQRLLTQNTATDAVRSALEDGAAMLVLALLAATIGGAVAWAITNTIKNQLGGEPSYAASIAREIAKGNLAVHVQLKSGDIDSLLCAMECMRGELARVVTDVRKSSEFIATGVGQIATGNADLSQRTEEQASNLEQTAASMEEMNASVRLNADTVRTATELATTSSLAAKDGGEIVARVVKTMEQISASSRKIGDIIGVIDSIAFQTNILALNAAVEAARAGEQGRGFAVVASEVRNLAHRSASAAKEIKALIGESVAKVDEGSELVGEAGFAMQDIVRQVKRVADLISEIGAATSEQADGISQVGEAVLQLDQVTQQNAALVEESAAAAASLNVQAAKLVDLVSIFNLHGAVHPSSRLEISNEPVLAVGKHGRTSEAERTMQQ